MKTDKPEFATWQRNNLDKLCGELWDENLRLREANEQLRLDLKDAMSLLRKQLTQQILNHPAL